MVRIPHRIRRVALMVEWSRVFGRGVLRGIGKYVQTHGRWKVDFTERKLSETAPGWLRHWKGDGIIARIEDGELARQIESLEIPVVDLYGGIGHIPAVITDHRAIGRMAAEHLIERGLQRFAYCGYPGVYPSDERCRHFLGRLAEVGHGAEIYAPPRRRRSTLIAASEYLEFQREGSLVRWIETLPKPIGMMAFNDLRANQILTACEENGVAVPEEVAVIGVDNDDVICGLSRPSLTSIEQYADEVGYQAAALLDRLMGGDAPPRETLRVKPRGIVARLSTDIVAVADADVAAALHYIREHACDGTTIDDILSHVPISRRTMERRFAELLGRSPMDEIIRIQLGYVKPLLSATDNPLDKIAPLAGFRYVQSMCVLFKKRTGRTPGQYRREVRS
jgi:LacI family transcriptional regulator